MNEIKNILDNYAWSEDGEYGDSKYTTDQALSDIRKYILEALPKEKADFGEVCFGCLNGSRCKVCAVQEHNQTLKDCREAIEGLFKD